MNRVYKVIWSAVSHSYIAVFEFARGKGKVKQSKKLMLLLPALLASVQADAASVTLGEGTEASTSGWNIIANANGRRTGLDFGYSAELKQGSSQTMAIGNNSKASGSGSMSIGDDADSTQTGAIAVGQVATSLSRAALAVGSGAYVAADSLSAMAMGAWSASRGIAAVSYGANSTADGNGAVAMGYSAYAGKQGAIAIGGAASKAGTTTDSDFNKDESTYVDSAMAVGIGHNVKIGSDADSSLALGDSAVVKDGAKNSVALGANSVADTANTVSVGSVGAERKITNVAVGNIAADSTDVVTGSQLFATNNDVKANADAIKTNSSNINDLQTSLNSGSTGLVRQDADSGDITVAAASGGRSVSFAGSEGTRTLSGVKDGRLIANSNEAVTGGQLFTTNNRVQANTDAIDVNSAGIAANKNAISTNRANIEANKTAIETNTADITTSNRAIKANTADIATNKTAIDTNTTDIAANKSAIETNSADIATSKTAIAANTADIATNTAGLASQGVTLAQHDGQLIGLAASLGGGAAINEDGSFKAPVFKVQGSDRNTVSDALTALDSSVTSNSNSIGELQTSLNSGSTGLVRQDADSGDITVASTSGGRSVSFAGSEGTRTLSGVKDGRLVANSNEAVTGGQLFTTNNRVQANTDAIDVNSAGIAANKNAISTNRANIEANKTAIETNTADITTSNRAIKANTADIAANTAGLASQGVTLAQHDGQLNGLAASLGGGAAINEDGSFKAPVFKVQGSDRSTVSDVLAALDTSVTSNSNSIGELQTSLNSGSTGLVRQDADSGDITVAAATGGRSVSFAGNEGTRTLSGVKDGRLVANSNEAVTGGQLFTTNNRVQANTDAIDVNSAGIAANKNAINTNSANIEANKTAIETNTADITTSNRAIKANTADIAANKTAIDAHTTDIAANKTAIDTNSADIATNKTAIDTNTTDIAANKSAIETNSADIATSKTAIAANTADIAANTAGLASQGVTLAQHGGQLSGLAASLGGGAAVNEDGSFKAPVFKVQGSDRNTVSDALTALDTSVTSNSNSIGELQTSLNSGSTGLVRQDADSGDITVAAASGGKSVNFAGSEGVRTLSGVKEGLLAADSSEAVTGSQLFATNTQMQANTDAIGANSTDIAANKTAIETNSTDIEANKSAIETNTTDIAANKSAIETNSSDIATSKTAIAANTADIAANTAGLASQGVTLAQHGGQLSGLAASLGGGAAVNEDGSFKAPVFKVQGSDRNTVSDALTALDSSVTSNSNSIGELQTSLNSGSTGLVRQDADSGDIAVAAASGGKSVNFAGSEGVRTLSGVKDGLLAADSSEAVTGSQLFATNTQMQANTDAIKVNSNDISELQTSLNSGSTGLVRQDADNGNISVASASGGKSVSFAGSEGARTLSGVKDGLLAANSSEAVTGGQLYQSYAYMGNLAEALGGGAAVDMDESAMRGTGYRFIAPSYTIQGQKKNNVGDAFEALDGAVTNNSNIINGLLNGSGGLVQQSGSGNHITIGGDSGGKILDVAGTDGSRVITGVAKGEISANSTDAVNGSQLHETNQQVAKNTDDISKLSGSVNDVVNGKAGLVQQETPDSDVAIANNSGGSSVSVDGTDGDRRISGVSDGVNDNDAATVGQLKNMKGDIGDAAMLAVNSDKANKPKAGGKDGIALGSSASAAGTSGVAIGAKASSAGENSVALGGGSNAKGSHSTALGANSSATAKNSVALGAGSVASEENTVSVGSSDSQRRITNVGRGVNSSDAATMGQMNEGFASLQNYTDRQVNHLNKRIGHVQDKLTAGIASAMALSGIPQAYQPDSSLVGASGGSYGGASAIAVGLSHISENGRWITKFQASGNTQSDFGGSVGIGFQW
ncbi:hypothetical protein TUM12370_32960 [Salmonella enterica subsp. enterica serovar Choleraesuis]|nr:hypothetical protein TUM12370_32960 [Salmonella enterica subsp. enterica serovar Choleraesuis]